MTPTMSLTRNHYINRESALTDDQLRAVAPSIFAREPWSGMSEKYAFIPTIEVVNKMRAEGFTPVQAMQSRTRVEGKEDFTKHLIRFRDTRQGDKPVVGDIYPEFLVTNAHDGGSAYKVDSGLFKAICTNGLVVGDSIISHINVAHRGKADGVIDATYEIIEQMPKVIESVGEFSRLRLDAGEQRAFGTAALALRYDEAAPITPDQVILPRRSEDAEPTLWNVFNRAQENLTQGGARYRTATGRRARVRAVEGITENTRLNKALWTLAEEMRKLRAA